MTVQDPSPPPQRVCVLGAGSSGIVAVKTLAERSLPFDCFEMGSDIGGNWRYDNDNGRSAAYDSLHIDTSKQRMAYSDFPMPESYPVYPHHSQVFQYFRDYVEHFGLRPKITFRTRVERVAPRLGGGYDVTFSPAAGGPSETRPYRSVLVCNGHHWRPKLPEIPGTFAGETFHSRGFRSARELEGKRVLVIGIGNSGVDIATDASRVAAKTVLSTRRSAHIVPRFILGKPTDQWVTPAGSRLPLALQRVVYRVLLYLAVGDQRRYGVDRPDFPLLSSHPTLSSELLGAVAHGHVEMRPDVAELAGDRVRFVDGAEDEIDVIIYATGYRISFPFFEPGFLAAPDNRVDLYGRVLHLDHPGLFFIGLIQPLGAIMPLAELQAQWVAGLLAGDLVVPPRRAMARWIERDRAALEKRYVDSSRHTIQVDFFPYRRFLRRQLRRTAR